MAFTEEIIAASRRLLTALDKLDEGSNNPGFRGWQNGNGEDCGDEVEDARESLAALLQHHDDREKQFAEYDAMVKAAPKCCIKHFSEAANGEPMTFMMLCKTRGNKRCPKATDCGLECTGSNEPGQVGSVYE